MKSNRIFIVVIIALMAVILLFEMNAPTRFKWDDLSQSYKSKQPFGCYVMDSVLRGTLPHGYEVHGSDIEKYIGKKAHRVKHTFLFTNNFEDFYADLFDSHEEDFLKMIEEGNYAIIATGYIDYYPTTLLEDTVLGYRCYSNSHSNLDYISKESLSTYASYYTVNWIDREKFSPASYPIQHVFCTNELNLAGDYRILATLDKERESDEEPATVAGLRNYGKGKIVVVSMPMIFSNYGILNDTIRPIVLRLLSECGDKPIVRYDPSFINQKVDNERNSESPLRYLLANRPLRWAFYLALATLVAFVFFSARRRQRVIPVIKPPVNHMMDFVKRIGGIYYKQHDNVDLLNKKYATFSNDLRVKAMIDIDNNSLIDDELQLLSNRTDIPLDELQRQIRDLKEAIKASSVSDWRLQQLIDVMNDIIHRINI